MRDFKYVGAICRSSTVLHFSLQLGHMLCQSSSKVPPKEKKGLVIGWIPSTKFGVILLTVSEKTRFFLRNAD